VVKRKVGNNLSAQRKVPFFDYPRIFLDDKAELMATFEEVSSRGAYILQKDLADFESNLASYTGAKHAIGVANATDGLELAWIAIRLKPGDEVIISSHTMLATASAIVTAGGTPVPVEIGDDNLIDPDAVSAAINERTVGISPTQLNGRTCNMDAIMKIATKHKLAVVEDAAQALGSHYKGKHAGTFGDAGSFSFFPAKVLGCLGDGGGVITNNSEIYEKVFQLHDHGRNSKGEIKSWGRNSRLDNLQAAILGSKLTKYNSVITRRRQIASIYESQLGFLAELSLPPAPSESGDNFDIYQNYELQADNRDELREYLSQQGIGTLIQWGGKGIHQWEGLGFTQSLPRVESFFQRCLMLPMNIFISDDDIEYICASIIKFYRS
jgi:dTDP-4-amino-4,6-dideoxygalactose transaminase